MSEQSSITHTADIVCAYVAANQLVAAEVPALIAAVHSALTGLGEPKVEAGPAPLSASEVRKTITPDGLRSLVDGRFYKSLKRHLSAQGMSPDDYRAKYGLTADYPMVAANYAKARSELALSLGLGRKPKGKA